MNRRRLMALALAAPLAPAAARADEANYRVSLVDGGRSGDRHMAGVLLELANGWITYWRMPGEAGVPPDFKWTGSANVAAIETLYPLPRRFTTPGGDEVGYAHRVLFPVAITPADLNRPVDLALDLFFAVCKDICIPGKARAALSLAPDGAAGDGPHVVGEWLVQVPQPAGGRPPVTASSLVLDGGRPALMLSLASPVDDIFVESASPAYFRKPDFAAGGRSARLVIDNVTDIAALSGLSVTLTLAAADRGIEQTITLA